MSDLKVHLIDIISPSDSKWNPKDSSNDSFSSGGIMLLSNNLLEASLQTPLLVIPARKFKTVSLSDKEMHTLSIICAYAYIENNFKIERGKYFFKLTGYNKGDIRKALDSLPLKINYQFTKDENPHHKNCIEYKPRDIYWTVSGVTAGIVNYFNEHEHEINLLDKL